MKTKKKNIKPNLHSAWSPILAFSTEDRKEQEEEKIVPTTTTAAKVLHKKK
jgi:hypothetical protein